MTADDPDPVLSDVAAAAGIGARGDRASAARLLDGLWQRIGGVAGDPLRRCAVAHALADVQDDPRLALQWDLRALAAGSLVDDDGAAAAGLAGSAAALLPSLHLNVADGYFRTGDVPAALRHVAAGLAALPMLPDDGYAAMVREGLLRVGEEADPDHGRTARDDSGPGRPTVPPG
ncbi:hypothetical protein [Nakamurella endophytica]|uniref:Uncharacterized protein n=1 Tax=Nakamurella endophytica TaxID=1748367 RepID=A0A917WAD8_9ACTN|nr:hypothetical protein [Nakamurella endophytica]GGL88425.1 hypothetical protein GCM10011594_05070 [Nakamurella endophytica]